MSQQNREQRLIKNIIETKTPSHVEIYFYQNVFELVRGQFTLIEL